MCYHHEDEWHKQGHAPNRPPRTPPPQQQPPFNPAVAAFAARSAALVENLRRRLADTEARLERARAREAALSRQLNDMKRFVLVMEIIESYLKRQFDEQRDLLSRLITAVPH